MIKSSRFNQFPADFDDVYAAIACAFRNGPAIVAGKGGSLSRRGITKGHVAAVHRKMLSGEMLDGDQEREIADRLRHQLGESSNSERRIDGPSQ